MIRSSVLLAKPLAGLSVISRAQYSSIPSEAVHQILDAAKSKSFVNPPIADDLSPKLRESLSNELRSFFTDFVENVDVLTPQAMERVANSGAFDSSGPGVAEDVYGRIRKVNAIAIAEDESKYTPAEMFLRLSHHNKTVNSLGAEIDYKSATIPHIESQTLKDIYDLGIKELIGVGAHLGHSVRRVRQNCLPYLYGTREGLHIFDLQQTLAGIRRCAKVVNELSLNAGLILYVGTRQGQELMVEQAAAKSNGYYVHGRWTPGTLTNFQITSLPKRSIDKVELNMADQNTNRTLSASLSNGIIKPDLVFILNPVENRPLLNECIKMRIPTAGIVDSDSEPSFLTYPIPGNDDSLSFAELVLRVMSKQASLGRKTRIERFKQHVIQMEREVEDEKKKKDVLDEKERMLIEQME